MTFQMLSGQVQICEINLNANDTELHYSSVVAILEELIFGWWMMDKLMWNIASS